uniref:Uncharacterized protein MANES_S023500 n=1 Tax=Rhizophora mucronata TaxID=61149 RepID=A0A2P2M4A9_RHIMU
MGLFIDCVKSKNFEEKSKSKKKSKVEGNGKKKKEIGCWIKFRSMGGCMPSRSKVDSSVSGAPSQYGNYLIISFASDSLF